MESIPDKESTTIFSTLEWLTTEAVKQHKTGHAEEAIAFYLEAIELEPNQPPWIYNNTITLLAELERFEEGLALGKQALTINNKADEVYRALGLLSEKQGDDLNSINQYQKAISLNNQQPNWLYCNLAKKLLENEQLEKALKFAYRGSQIYPSFYPLHYVLGDILVRSEQWDKAISSYQKVQKLNPNWLEVEQKINHAIYCKSQAERLVYYQDYQFSSKPAPLPIKTNEDTKSENVESIDKINKESELNHLFTQLQNNRLSLSECHQIWQDFAGIELELDYGCWLSPHILYLEVLALNHCLLNQAKILVCSNSQYAIADVELFQISPQQIAGVVCFERNIYTENYDSYRLCIRDNSTLIFINKEIAQKAYNLEFIDHLKGKPNDRQHLIRESLSKSIIKLIAPGKKSEAANFLRKIQLFLDIPPTNYVDLNLPFKIFIDYIIPLKYEGLFISGWLQDFYTMLEKITIISALGFSLELPEQEIYRLERHDVNQFLQNTRYENSEEKLGFCAYVPVPENIYQSINGFAELHSFRFLVKLKGNIEIEIIPDAKYSDLYTARQKVMQIASPDRVSDSMLINCIAPAGLKLQQLCIEQVGIKDVIEIGSSVENPLISIIIPLYRRLDFLKVQFVKMANDLGIKQCEVIYVLDSPEQEEEVKSFLTNHSTLYQLPVKLVVMKQNSGYAAANNAGASQAIGEYLILLNSDVFPETKGWMVKMADFYASSPKIGVLGAKLLYEDGSLQHAGMFFAKKTFPFWLTLHYHKGLPRNYPPAQVTKSVPAVTGACLMIGKELYNRVQGLTTDYVIGDFEDSDLCLKCRELGYESWYCADVTLYHLERQSVPLNSSFNGSLAWQLNAHLHQLRWGQQIAQLMTSYLS